MEYTQNYYQGARERSNLKNNYQDARQKQVENSKQQRTKRPRVGTLGSMIELTKQLVHDLARSKEKRQKIKEMTKMDVIAIVLTIVVVILIGVILWFIPFTNGWMRELLFENPLFNWIGGLFS